MAGALSNADTTGQFLTLGGEKAYMYGYEPNYLWDEYGINCWGNNMLFLQNKSGGVRSPTSACHAARMLTSEWAIPEGGRHLVFRAESNVRNMQREEIISAYALLRPDHRWSLMLINKDPARSHDVSIRLARAGTLSPLRGTYEISQFSSRQYVWHADGRNGYPSPSNPPARWTAPDRTDARFILPAYSLTVVRGHAENGN